MGQRYAFLFGVNEFIDPNLPKLITPLQNVSDLESLLNNPEVGGFNEVKTLSQKSQKSDIEREIVRLFKNKGKDDLLLLYFSGHGILDEQGMLFFALHETEKDLPEVTALSSIFIRNFIESSYSEQIVIILDCCYSGAFGRGRMGSTNESVNLRDSFSGRGYGRVVLTASNTTSLAWEGDQFVGDVEHSVFTSFLIEGLKSGEADRNQDGNITVNELYEYIQAKLEQKVLKQRATKITFRDEKEIVIAKNPNLYRVPRDLQAAATDLNSYVREAAVRRLIDLVRLRQNNPRLIQEAINLLRNLSADPNPQVADFARHSLEEIEKPEVIENNLITLVQAMLDQPKITPPDELDENKQRELRDAYLKWVIQLHSWLELLGVREAKRYPLIPLDKVYVALKGDRSSAYERLSSQEQLDVQLMDAVELMPDEFTAQEMVQHLEEIRRQILVENPIMISLAERDRSSLNIGAYIEKVTLAEAFQQERSLVILGDPGSGKTTLERWLAIKLAQAMLDKELTVAVAANQVDPEAGESNKNINLGPTRLPVLLRVSDYAEAFLKARKEGRTLPLVDYLGHHSWLGKHPTKDGKPFTQTQLEALNKLIKRYLDKGEAVILLDGMDEISSSGDRQDIVDAIVDFIDEKILPSRNTIATSRVKNLTLEYQIARAPFEVGGNQIVITSRIAGYHAAPIKRDLTHVTIEPMSRVAIEYFCDVWSLAINRLIQPTTDLDVLEQTALQQSARLKADIFDPARPRIRELASNPLLVTTLALVHRQQGGLPERRADLYQRALEILVEDWRKTGLLTEELIYVLSPLAAHIHQKYATGLIQKNELKQIVTRELAVLRNVDPDDPPPSFQRDVREFLRVVREDVGILAAHGEELYGFLHLTFQEYLAALFLIRSKKTAATEIIARLDNPRWREPILLALGHIGSNWLPDQSEKVLLAMLAADEPLGTLIPRTPMLIVSALDEMANVSPLIIQEVVRRLLVTYADRNGLMRFDRFRDQIERQFIRLRSTKNNPIIDHILCELIANPSQNRDIAPAVVTLIRRQQWFSPAITEVLMKVLPYDSVEWDWPINKALREMVTPQQLVEPQKYKQLSDTDWEHLRANDLLQYRNLKAQHTVADEVYAEQKAKYDLNKARPLPELNLDSLPFKQTLLKAPHLVERIRGDAHWTRLIIALYGGYYDYKAADILFEYTSIAHFLQQPDQMREQEIQSNREYYIGQFGPDDTIYNAAVYLDTGMNGKTAQVRSLPEFAAEAIFRDSPLTPRLLAALKADKEASSLVPEFWRLWSGTSKPELQVDALVALATLGEDVIPTLEEALATDERHVLAQAVLGRLAQLADLLRDPIARAFNQKFEQIEQNKNGSKETKKEVYYPIYLLNQLVDELSDQDWADIFVTLANTMVTYTGQPFTYDPPKPIMTKGIATEYVLSEYWVNAFLGGYSDDTIYACAVALDKMQGDESLSLADRIRSLAMIHKTQNLHYRNYIGHWSVEPLSSRSDDPTDMPLDVIRTVEAVNTGELSPDLQNAVLSAFLDSTWTIVRDNANLLPEYLALNLKNYSSRKAIAHHLVKLMPSLTVEACYSLPSILEMARKLKDPYYCARALLRVAELWPDQRFALVGEALSKVRHIPILHLRCQVLEFLLPHLPPTEYFNVLAEAVNVAHALDDPNHKARALARLSRRFNGDKKRSLLLEAIQSAAAIADVWWCAETLRELQSELHDDPLLLAELRFTARQMRESKDRHRALDQRGINMFALRDHLTRANNGDHRLWTPIELGALVNDILRYFSVATNMDGTWNAIMNDPTSSEANQIYEQAIESGLTLTQTVGTVINHWIETDQHDAAKCFMPLLQDLTTEVIPIVENWLTHYDDFIANHAALYLAESNRQLTPRTIHGLLSLLAEPEDRSRLRVPLILYGGDGVIDGHSPRFFKASELDHEVFLALGQERHYFRTHNISGAASELFRVTLEMLFDDPDLITQLSQKVNSEGFNSDAAAETLEMMVELTEDAWSVLRQSFEQGGPKLRYALMVSILQLCITGYKREHDEDPASWLKSLSSQSMPGLCAVPGGTTSFMEAGQEALQLLDGNVDGSELAQIADDIMEKKYTVSVNDVLRLPTSQIR